MWKEINSELTNKIRWAIGTTSSSAGFNLSYGEQKAMASVLAGDVLVVMKLKQTSPNYHVTAEAFRKLSTKDLVPSTESISPFDETLVPGSYESAKKVLDR